MGQLWISVMGPLTVQVAGHPIKLVGRQQRLVLAFLVLRANTVVATDALEAGLWPTEPPAHPRAALHVYLATIRRLLAPVGSPDGTSAFRLETVQDGYRLRLNENETDLSQLRRWAGDGRAAAVSGDLVAAAESMARARALMTGPPYRELAEVDAVQPELAAIREECVDIEQERLEIELALGRHRSVVPDARASIDRHPFRERLWAALIVSLYQSERQADALGACQEVRRLFAEELGIDPGPRLAELELAVLRQDPSLSPVDLSEARRPRRRIDNLPRPATPLVGRDEEVSTVASLVETEHMRLVTITGSGGIGKTRLALAVATKIARQNHEGACWVELAAVAEAGHVPGAIAAALGVTQQAGYDLLETIIDFLGERKPLLVLDNFEHVSGAWPVVSRLIASTPGLTILITSRRALRIREEIEHALLPLALPLVIEADADPDQVARVPAVQLLVERARAARPGFALTAGNAGTVVQICRRVDGLPLALELAGAQLRQRSEVSVLRGLDSMMHAEPILVDLPARQRTLGATITWSYQLLEPAERRAFERMGAFAGDPTIEAVAQICAEPLGEIVPETIDAVADHSLAGRRFDSSGECRLTMLTPIREFARARLDRRPDANTVREQHARHYLRWSAQLALELLGPNQRAALSRLRAERADLTAAFHWSAGRPETNELALGFVGELWHLWELTGEVAVPGAIAELAVAAITPDTDQLVAARALSGLATLRWLEGRIDQAVDLHRSALEAFRRIGDDAGVAWSQMCLAVQAMSMHDPPTAVDFIHKALANPGASDRVHCGSLVLSGLLQLQHAGALDAAAASFTEAVDLALGTGDRWLLAHALVNLGEADQRRGRLDQAETAVREALRTSQDLGAHILGASCLETLAALQIDRQLTESAARLLAATAAYRTEMALRASPPEQQRLDHLITRARRDLGPVRFAIAWAAGQAMSITQAVREAIGD